MTTLPSLLPAGWQIPDAIRQRLGDDPGRQRAMLHDGHLLLVLHALPVADDEARQGRYFWRQPDGTWSAAGMAGGQGALSAHLEEYEAAIEALDREEFAAQSARDYFDVMSSLTPLARAGRNLYEALQEARQKISDDRRLILARDRAYALSRHAELLQADAQHTLNFMIARRAEEQAATSHQMAVASHRLNLLVAFFFPLATLMAIFGANLGHGLEGWDSMRAPLPLLSVLGLGLAMGIVLTLFVTRRPRLPEDGGRRDEPPRGGGGEER